MLKRTRSISTTSQPKLKRARTAAFSGGSLARQPFRRTKFAEKKVVDVAPSSFAADTTGSVTLLNGVATGTDFNNRIGRKTVLRSLNIIGHLIPQDSAVANTLCRLIVVYDQQPNGAAPAITDVLDTADSRSQLNLNNRDRFKVLVNHMVALSDNAANQVGSPSTSLVSIYRKINMETIFSGTGATAASIASGALFMITVGDNVAGAGYNFSVSTRVRFEDE